MILNAGCQFDVTTDAGCPLVLMLRPVSGLSQSVLTSAVEVGPGIEIREAVDLYGNHCQRLMLPAGSHAVVTSCQVDVSEHIDVDSEAGFTSVDDLPAEVLGYLLPSRYCQSDLLLERATRIVRKAEPGYQQVEAIRSWISRKVKYKYGTSGPTTSALDTAKSRKGVCRDFAHLGIALCRAIRIPARMVSGYLHELEPMDLHAWFEAYVGGRWYTFDATQAEPKGNRIVLAYGRDAADIAFMSGYGPAELTNFQVWVEAVPS